MRRMSERVVVDKAGRIVIPKGMRQRIGLEDGDVVRIDEQDGALVVRQEKEEIGLVRRGKRLFKPKDRKAGILDPEEVNRIIEIMRDPELRNAFEVEHERKERAHRAKRKQSGRR